jgi:hypothetical protein
MLVRAINSGAIEVLTNLCWGKSCSMLNARIKPSGDAAFITNLLETRGRIAPLVASNGEDDLSASRE